jgi:hypothetical protein
MYTYHCTRTTKAIVVDGDLEDTAWQVAAPMVFRATLDGAAPRFPTTARMLWDDEHLYISYHCVDEDIWSTMTERDDHLWEEEAVEVFLDADRDRVGYVEIQVNPLNTLLDLFILNRQNRPAKQLYGWDSQKIQHAVCVTGDPRHRGSQDSHWTVEMAIPWEDFVTAPHQPPHVGDVWLVNLFRIERPQWGDEFSAWSPTGASNYHVPDRFGELVFVE